MKLFVLKDCPYCQEALKWIAELKKEDPRYQQLEIEVIDEALEVELANSYDYYYVPTIFDGNLKLHEGIATKAKIKKIFDKKLASR
ncbi:glutaredoxin [uncultured Thomasclavelia sp.]|uniref:glutaredoxin n=1 Tax=uncultured Thomasclavelia sp. TaxID=3025759 RepID=UPI0025E77C0B|nr:glutaredoxin [uncultured Thomasclavelia sp.]